MAAAQGDVTVALDYRRLRALYKLVPNLLRTDIFCLFVNSSESPAWLTMISYALALWWWLDYVVDCCCRKILLALLHMTTVFLSMSCWISMQPRRRPTFEFWNFMREDRWIPMQGLPHLVFFFFWTSAYPWIFFFFCYYGNVTFLSWKIIWLWISS